MTIMKAPTHSTLFDNGGRFSDKFAPRKILVKNFLRFQLLDSSTFPIDESFLL